MKTALKIGAVAVMMLLARTATGADDLAAGKVKSVDAENKKFVLTDPTAGKEWTFKFGDKFLINRGGQESQGDLKVNDAVLIHYDKGVVNWTAKYIVVQEGDSMHWTMAHGAFKGYDSASKELTFTDAEGKDMKYAMGDAAVRLNYEKSTIGDIKIGDHVLAVLETGGERPMVKFLIAERE